MGLSELLIILLVAVVAFGVLAERLNIPYPILFVLGGLALSVVPGLPRVTLAPNLIFYLFLPPLVTSAGWRSSIRDLRVNIRPIVLLAVGLVLVTLTVIGAVAHLAMNFAWPLAFVLGAIVSPTDDVAVLAVAERLPIPSQATTIVSAEGLFNDATSLVAYGFALMAVVSGNFSLTGASLHFIDVIAGSLAVGIAVGLIYERAARHVDDPALSITLTLLLPFAAYLPADALGTSGVLAAVIAGLYGGWREAWIRPANIRRPAIAVWDMIIFLLNAVLFLSVGLEFPDILHELDGQSIVAAGWDAILISLTLILLRLAWVFLTAYAPAAIRLFPHHAYQLPDWRNIALVAWAGPRGAVSLAAALAIPLIVPDRGLIIFLTYGVIFATLVLQGLSLPLLIHWLGVSTAGLTDREEAQAWVAAARTALKALDNPSLVNGAPAVIVNDLRRHYEQQIRHYAPIAEGSAKSGKNPAAVTPSAAVRQLRLKLIDAERSAVIELRDQGEISDEVLRIVERDLDLEELRVE